MLNKLIISAPFGNYFQKEGITSTLGTFTLHKRAGFFKRWYKVLSTVRYHSRNKIWTNKLGLPNPGIDSLFIESIFNRITKSIISIHGFSKEEWTNLANKCSLLFPAAVELNLSCPNVESSLSLFKECLESIEVLKAYNILIIAKLAPLRWMDLAAPLYEVGIRYFHCCNTIPTPGGGLSGKVLKNYSLWCVDELRSAYSDVKLIAGGGITSIDDIKDYYKAGADHFSVASFLFNPFNWKKLEVFKNYLINL